MEYNLLIDSLPTEYGGYKLNTSFRQPLKMLRLLKDQELDEIERAAIYVRMFFPEARVRDFQRLSEYIDYYVSRGREQKDDGSEPVFDLEQDANRIHAAFLQVYHIDLSVEDMHWWKFLSLLENLPDGTMLSHAISVRAMKVPRRTKENAEYVDSINRQKKAFALGVEKTVGQKLQDLWGNL